MIMIKVYRFMLPFRNPEAYFLMCVESGAQRVEQLPDDDAMIELQFDGIIYAECLKF